MNKFCKVCKDMGKPESVWKSHYVRQTPHPNSDVTCPTILSNVCKFCNIKGHLISTCAKKKKELKQAKQQVKEKRFVDVQRDVPIVKTRNAFYLLNYDTDSDTEDNSIPVVVSKKRAVNWANMDSDNESDEE